MQWGDPSFIKEPIGDFIGHCPGQNQECRNSKQETYFKNYSVDSRDVKLHYLEKYYHFI